MFVVFLTDAQAETFTGLRKSLFVVLCSIAPTDDDGLQFVQFVLSSLVLLFCFREILQRRKQRNKM